MLIDVEPYQNCIYIFCLLLMACMAVNVLVMVVAKCKIFRKVKLQFYWWVGGEFWLQNGIQTVLLDSSDLEIFMLSTGASYLTYLAKNIIPCIQLVEKGTKLVLEQVVTTLASVADTAEEKFEQYYNR